MINFKELDCECSIVFFVFLGRILKVTFHEIFFLLYCLVSITCKFPHVDRFLHNAESLAYNMRHEISFYFIGSNLQVSSC